MLIYTVGYEQRDIEDFVKLLTRNGVDRLVDVRLNAISRKRGFSKTRLSEALGAAGIDYEHVRELGNPQDNREGFRAGQTQARERYRAKLFNGSSDALDELIESTESMTVAVLCFERDQSACHRDVIVQEAQERRPELVVVPL